MPKKLPLKEGQVFGEWTVMSAPLRIAGKTKYKCRCSCGNVHLVSWSKLHDTAPKRCFSCTARINYEKYTKAKWDSVRSNAVGDLSGTFFSHIRQAAKSRGIEFSVSKEELWSLLVAQDFKCALSGDDITLSLARKKSDPDFSKITASLDRIDSSKGYTSGNIQWLHKDVNKMKWILNNREFIALCHKIVSKHGNTEPSPGNS